MDLIDVTAPELQALAQKLEPLMKSSRGAAERDPLDYLLGALHALFQAKQLGYQHRPQSLDDKYWNEGPLPRVGYMAQGKLRVEGKWLAGFYFNSALVRLAAAFDRTVRLKATRKKIKVKKRPVWNLLLDLGLQRFSKGKLARVYREVNPLKHAPEGLATGRRITMTDATQAFDEMLDLLNVT